MRSTGQLGIDSIDPIHPISTTRQCDVVVYIHQSDLSALQSDHDKLLLEETALVQRQTSGRLAHRTTSDKRNHDKLLRSVQRSRRDAINKMRPHVEFLQAVPDHPGLPPELPDDWERLAREGSPFWHVGDVVPADGPSEREKDAVVEFFLKRCRAWEQLTSIVPREARDALEHLSLLELQARACNDAIVSDINALHDARVSSTTTSNGREPHPTEFDTQLGRLVQVNDLLSTLESSRRDCASAWLFIHDLVESSPQVASILSPVNSGLHIQASLPILDNSLYPPPAQVAQETPLMPPVAPATEQQAEQ